jgi:hypothetical protein
MSNTHSFIQTIRNDNNFHTINGIPKVKSLGEVSIYIKTPEQHKTSFPVKPDEIILSQGKVKVKSNLGKTNTVRVLGVIKFVPQ